MDIKIMKSYEEQDERHLSLEEHIITDSQLADAKGNENIANLSPAKRRSFITSEYLAS